MRCSRFLGIHIRGGVDKSGKHLERLLGAAITTANAAEEIKNDVSRRRNFCKTMGGGEYVLLVKISVEGEWIRQYHTIMDQVVANTGSRRCGIS